MSKLRTLIVDDEPLALEGLRLRLAQFDSVELIAECADGNEALEAIGKHQPDLVFMDLEMPGLTGLEVVQSIQSDNVPLIVFVTAYNQYAVDAFEMHAVDYILKPVDVQRLKKAIIRAKERKKIKRESEEKQKLIEALSQVTKTPMDELESWLEDHGTLPSSYPENLAIKEVGKSTRMLPVNTIEWIDAAGDYMCLHAEGETHVMRITMKKLQAMLNPQVFQRIHKSTIVNLRFIHEVRSHTNSESVITLKNGSTLKVSRNYKDHINALLQNQVPIKKT